VSNHELAFDNAFEAVLDAISDGVYVTDDQRRIVYWNKSAERITGYAADEVLGSHCHDNVLVHQDLDGRQLCVAVCPLARTIETGEPNTFSEVMLKRKDGRRLSVYVKTARLQAGGRNYGVEIFGELDAVAGRDLVERIQQLSDASVTDVLTGQFNRRYVDVAMAQHFSLYQRLGQRFGVTLIDVDNLKEINDEFGHSAGDTAIRFVAGILADNARKMDIVTRYGGDEFVVINASHSEEDLRVQGERMVTLVRGSRLTLPLQGCDVVLTVSAGGTLVQAIDIDEHSMLERADSAMYAAKRNGGDRYVLIA
jgi:diguanylate cyclase (GGDEF)-like protein/PAS domain S-box-containing protein